MNHKFRQWTLKIDKNDFKKCNIKVILISSKNGHICISCGFCFVVKDTNLSSTFNW